MASTLTTVTDPNNSLYVCIPLTVQTRTACMRIIIHNSFIWLLMMVSVSYDFSIWDVWMKHKGCASASVLLSLVTSWMNLKKEHARTEDFMQAFPWPPTLQILSSKFPSVGLFLLIQSCMTLNQKILGLSLNTINVTFHAIPTPFKLWQFHERISKYVQ